MNGKGSRRRPTDETKFGESYDRIFGKPKPPEPPEPPKPNKEKK